MAILTGRHSSGVASFACAQAGCPDCLETLLQENKGLIQSTRSTHLLLGLSHKCLTFSILHLLQNLRRMNS